MIYPNVKPEEWAEKHGLEIRDETCNGCGKTFSMNVPIATQGMAGLSMPVHACGENFAACTLTPMTAKSKQFWSKVVGSL